MDKPVHSGQTGSWWTNWFLVTNQFLLVVLKMHKSSVVQKSNNCMDFFVNEGDSSHM